MSTAVHSNKRQVRPPTYHFKTLIKEACPNHAYPIRNKLNDCSIMKTFMTTGSLTWGAELNEDPGGSDTMPPTGEMSCV
jgi:hypothetical protein